MGSMRESLPTKEGSEGSRRLMTQEEGRHIVAWQAWGWKSSVDTHLIFIILMQSHYYYHIMSAVKTHFFHPTLSSMPSRLSLHLGSLSHGVQCYSALVLAGNNSSLREQSGRDGTHNV